MHNHDINLIKRAKNGDRAAFGELVNTHYMMMYRVAYRFLGNQADAEDLAQDICVKLPEKLEHFRGDSAVSTWLYQIILNSCRDRIRQRKTRGELTQRYLEIEHNENQDALDTRKKLAWLYRQIAQMEPLMQETALLVLTEQRSHAEAGTILNCSESTVSWRMHEIRKWLKAKLDTYP